jgi:hypothetical protein
VAVTLSIVAAGFAIFRVVGAVLPGFRGARCMSRRRGVGETEADPVAVWMSLGKTIRLGLAAKLAICVIASTAAFFALFGFINLRAERATREGWSSRRPTASPT